MAQFTLRSARMLKDIKIREIAQKLDVSPTTWVNYESNKTKIPAKLFLEFCEIVELDPKTFILE